MKKTCIPHTKDKFTKMEMKALKYAFDPWFWEYIIANSL